MEIITNSGHKVLVDEEDGKFLKWYHWCVHHGYAVANGVKDGKRCSLYMHRLIMNTPIDMEVDHINMNRLDNRRINLRNCTTKNNCYNRGSNKNNKSGFKCVYKAHGMFKARVKFNGKNINLGKYPTAIEAAKAYNKWAIKNHGEFAYLNKIDK